MNASSTFDSGGRKYAVDVFGVVHQIDPKPFSYTPGYVGTYSRPEYRENARALSLLRLGWVGGVFNAVFRLSVHRLLDVGYGSGSFLREASRLVRTTHGLEAADVPAPPGSVRVRDFSDAYDVITFWDSLEHFPDLSIVRDLNARLLAVSVPWCHRAPDPWFDAWKHRKPDEHLHHFSLPALDAFMASAGWTLVAWGSHEDTIRTPADGLPNILSAAFIRAGS